MGVLLRLNSVNPNKAGSTSDWPRPAFLKDRSTSRRTLPRCNLEIHAVPLVGSVCCGNRAHRGRTRFLRPDVVPQGVPQSGLEYSCRANRYLIEFKEGDLA